MAEQDQCRYNTEDCAVVSNSDRVTATATILDAPGDGYRLGITSAAAYVVTAEASDNVIVEDSDGNFDIIAVLSATAGTNVERNFDPRTPFLLPENKALVATSTMSTGVILVSATAIKIKVPS